MKFISTEYPGAQFTALLEYSLSGCILRLMTSDWWPARRSWPGPLVPWSQSHQCRPLHKVHSLLQLSPNRGRPEPACNHCLMPNCTFMTRHRLPHAYSASILSNFLNSWNTSQYHCQEEETQLSILLITVDNDQGLFFLLVLLKHFTSCSYTRSTRRVWHPVSVRDLGFQVRSSLVRSGDL